MEKLNEYESYEERVEVAIKMSPIQTKYSDKFIGAIAAASYDRLKVVLNYNTKTVNKLKSPIVLMRPKENPPNVTCEDNYSLDKFSDNLTVHFLEGNHVSIIENKDCANIINRMLAERDEKTGKVSDNVVTNMLENQREVKV